MALTTIYDPNTPGAGNRLIRYTQDINREFCRENMFSPYMGEDMTAIIRVRNELKAGGELMNLPVVTRLLTGIQSSGNVSTVNSGGALVNNEEQIDNYGQRVKVDWARNAVVTNKAENQKDSADIFGEAKPLLSDWGRELQRDEIIAALMALPSETLPAAGVRVNGLLYQTATATQRGQWQLDNKDRVLFGALVSNRVQSSVATDHAASLANLDITNDLLSASNLSLLKRVAMNAVPKIRPFKTRDGYEYYVAFCGTNPFRDLKVSLGTVNKDARPREAMGPNGAPDNPIFQDGDQIYDGVIVRCVPEISAFVTNVWTTLLTAGGDATLKRVEPVFLCGQQAAAFCWGQMAKPTFRKEDDYGFITGTGIDMCYGTTKIFKKHPSSGTSLVQFGMATGFFASPSD